MIMSASFNDLLKSGIVGHMKVHILLNFVTLAVVSCFRHFAAKLRYVIPPTSPPALDNK